MANAIGGWRRTEGLLRTGWITPVMLALAALLIWAIDWRSVPTAASAGDFDTPAALRDIDAIAAAPRPTGSPAAARARDYLVAQLRASGLSARVDRRLTHVRTPSGQVQFAWIENVVAVLPGADHNRALLLMAHYDSVAWAPGAADDAAGVATVLQTARQLAALPQRRRDVVVLLTDGEEIGLLGARAFFESDPLARRISTVLNFEARGSSGPAVMFQSTPGRGDLIDAFAAAPQPISSSYYQALYRLLPNDTDYTVFAQHAVAGMNFAFADGFFDYHSPTDTVANLSAASVAQMGGNAFAIARRLITSDAAPAPRGSAVRYLTVGGNRLIAYPAWLDLIVLVAVIALAGLVMAHGIRARRYTLVGLARGAAAALVLLLGAGTIVFALSAGVYRLSFDAIARVGVIADQRWWFVAWALLGTGVFLWLAQATARGIAWPVAAVLGGIVALAPIPFVGPYLPAIIAGVVVAAGLIAIARRPLAPDALADGGLGLVVVAMATLALLAPEIAAILAWPLLFALCARLTVDMRPAIGTAAWVVALVAGTLILGAVALDVNLALGADLPVAAVLPLLILTVLMIAPIVSSSAVVVGPACAVAGLGLVAVMVAVSPFDLRHPRPAAAFLLQDDRRNTRCVASIDDTLTPWHRRALGGKPEFRKPNGFAPDVNLGAWCGAVGGPAAPPMQITDARVASIAGGQRLTLRVLPADGADVLILYVPGAVDLRGAAIDGRPVPVPARGPAKDFPWRLRGYAIPREGFVLTLDFAGSALPTQLLATRLRYGGVALPPRPPGLMRGIYSFSDVRVQTAVLPVAVGAQAPLAQ